LRLHKVDDVVPEIVVVVVVAAAADKNPSLGYEGRKATIRYWTTAAQKPLGTSVD
jgi:hypothetical protein